MSRLELLKKLLNMDDSLDTLNTKLAEFGWDSEEGLVVLEKKHILNILKIYLENHVDNNDVEDWANAIECREDIGRASMDRELIEDILYELANPELTQELSKARAKQLYEKLV